MRLIDADALDNELEALKVRFKALGRDNVVDDYNFVQTVLLTAPTVDAAPVNNNPCGFCGKFNFGDAKAEVYRHGANIVIASALARFPVEEQFNFCPVCGRCVKKGGASND